MQKIIPTLWYDFNADEAIALYQDIFKDNFKEIRRAYYDETIPHGKPGEILTIEFELFGQRFVALNGGPDFPFTNAVSLMIECKTQDEIDYYWNAFLKSGGKEVECGWILDRFGLPWQVTPTSLNDMRHDPDKKKAQAVMGAMMKMVKLNIAELERAYKKAG